MSAAAVEAPARVPAAAPAPDVAAVGGRYLADPNGPLTPRVPADHTWSRWLLSHGAHAVRHPENPPFSDRWCSAGR
ncbi:hypothetical protein [Catenuloplanes atrovinosus]|uniref:Uncharacterized protein n=1 Tax=Catenuloplanes atrovinosus TaxID=137266 RepID=A0AAE4C894_9ACTN|nr:hypothetical protein [Catenuloplanes atrovinosus]MDR7274753.1 hypothetical protein [Catenuloplanes atrovinosus]